MSRCGHQMFHIGSRCFREAGCNLRFLLSRNSVIIKILIWVRYDRSALLLGTGFMKENTSKANESLRKTVNGVGLHVHHETEFAYCLYRRHALYLIVYFGLAEYPRDTNSLCYGN